MRFEGTLQSWNDDKSFGFIRPTQGGQDIFVHISEYRRGGRPVLNEALTFEVALNPQGKKRAVNVKGGGAQQVAYPPGGSHRAVRVRRSGSSSGSGLKMVMALLLVAALGWQGYLHHEKVFAHIRGSSLASPAADPGAPLLDLATPRAKTSLFSCDGRQHCSQMSTCKEAKYFLKNCPGTKMDGDHDGVPCEQDLCKWPWS